MKKRGISQLKAGLIVAIFAAFVLTGFYIFFWADGVDGGEEAPMVDLSLGMWGLDFEDEETISSVDVHHVGGDTLSADETRICFEGVLSLSSVGLVGRVEGWITDLSSDPQIYWKDPPPSGNVTITTYGDLKAGKSLHIAFQSEKYLVEPNYLSVWDIPSDTKIFDWGKGSVYPPEQEKTENLDSTPSPSDSNIQYMVESSVENLNTNQSAPTSSLVENANRFAFDIHSKLAEEGKNSFISPYSIYTCLGMVYEGARGETATEMEQALNLPSDESVRRPAFADLQKKLNIDRLVELETANALWPQEDYPFKEDYLDVVRNYYLADIAYMDYIDNEDGAINQINSWAAEHTKNKINEVINDIPPLTRLILTNAIYFKGNWAIEFDKSRTEENTFYLSDGSAVETPMMQFPEDVISDEEFYYTETEGLKALKLFYKGGKASMILLLPENSPKGVEWLNNNVTQSTLRTVEEKFEKKEMSEIKIPKFEFEVNYKEEFQDALQELGMNMAFSLESANFTGMEKAVKNLFISKTTHKAYIKVNEVGTVAAAATDIFVVTGVQSEPEPSFVANRPFMFLIKDEETETILFMGSVENPQK